MNDGKTALALSANLSLTKEDIITIKISEIEESAELEIERLGMLSKELDKKSERENAAKAKAIEDFLLPLKEQAGQTEASALRSWFTDVKVNVNVGRADSLGTHPAGFVVSASIRGARKNDIPEHIARNSRHSNNVDDFTMTVNKFVEMPADIKLFDQRISELAEQKLDVNEKIFQQKKILAQLPRTARRATAALAKAMLTNGGDANNMLLETLRGVSVSGAKRLG